MPTGHKPLPITAESIDAILTMLAAARHDAGFGDSPDSFGNYLADHWEELVARFKSAQGALAS